MNQESAGYAGTPDSTFLIPAHVPGSQAHLFTSLAAGRLETGMRLRRL